MLGESWRAMRMAFVDTAQSNTHAIEFFKGMGYGKPEAEVWMSKVLQRRPKAADRKSLVAGRRKHSRSERQRAVS
jgi:hypothetical protein